MASSIPAGISITRVEFDGRRTWAFIDCREFRQSLWISGRVRTASEFYAVAEHTITRMRQEAQ